MTAHTCPPCPCPMTGTPHCRHAHDPWGPSDPPGPTPDPDAAVACNRPDPATADVCPRTVHYPDRIGVCGRREPCPVHTDWWNRVGLHVYAHRDTGTCLRHPETGEWHTWSLDPIVVPPPPCTREHHT